MHYLRPEHSGVRLHGLLQAAANLRHAEVAGGVAQLVQALDGLRARIRRQIWLGCSWLALLSCQASNSVVRFGFARRSTDGEDKVKARRQHVIFLQLTGVRPLLPAHKAAAPSSLLIIQERLGQQSNSQMVMPQARPNTTMSRSELAPRRLAPCTDAQAASPAAYSPGTMALGSSLVGFTTWPLSVVGMPPIL